MLRRLIVLLAAIAGVGLAVAAPAGAAPNWQTYTRTPGWTCTDAEPIQPHLFMTACVNSNATNHAQAIVVLSNYTGVTKTITAPDVDLVIDDGRRYLASCGSYQIRSGTSRACLGYTRGPFCNWLWGDLRVTVNGVSYDWTSPTKPVC